MYTSTHGTRRGALYATVIATPLALALPPLVPSSVQAGEPTCCTVDFWCQHMVDVFDLIFVFQDWGSTKYPWADFNMDGIVDGQDSGYLLAHWGPCTQDLPQPEPGELFLWGQDVTPEPIADMGKRVWDIYLTFTNPDILLVNVYDVDIACQDGIDLCFFHGDPSGDPKEPSVQATPFPQWLWDMGVVTYDSFVTVGKRYGDDNAVEGDPSLHASDFLEGTRLGGHLGGAGWFSLPPDAQGTAGDYPGNRILIASLTVPSNAALTGEVSAMYQQPDGELVIGTAEVKLTKFADLNFDGVVDVSDLLILLGNWGPCEPGVFCVGDLNQCGVVDVSDMLILLGNWG